MQKEEVLTKQTAVEWLFDHLVPHLDWSKVEDRELFRKLKAEVKVLEKFQIMKAYNNGASDMLENKYKNIHEYYQKTFGGENEQD
jgi:hypothetical protein